MSTKHFSKVALSLFVFLFGVFGCVSPESNELEDLAEKFPVPELTPLDVVQIQMDAFQKNDETNQGIAIAFRFASPANQSLTGPIERFTGMIRSGAYAAMVNSVDLVYGEVVIRGPIAQVPVTVISADGSSLSYLFTLGKQTQDPYDQCWMTESVQFYSTTPPGNGDAGNTAAGWTYSVIGSGPRPEISTYPTPKS